MSVYLGDQKVGVAFVSGSTSGDIPPTTPDFNVDWSSEAEWTRPNGWPDLDSLNLTASGDDYIYMTYDCDPDLSVVSWQITGTNIAVSIGHISSGSYVSEETITGSSNKYQLWLDNYSGYKVVKVSGNITECYVIDSPNTSDNQKVKALNQHMLERIAYVPHLAGSSFGSSQFWGTMHLQRDKFMTGSSSSSLKYMRYMWYQNYNLRKVELNEVDTSNVIEISNMFYQCYNLVKVDFSNSVFNKLQVASSAFSECHRIEEIIFNNLHFTRTNTSNTVVTNMFNRCFNLKKIQGIANLISDKVSSLDYLFAGCNSLKNIDFIKSWNTSNVSSLSGTFNGCWNLREIDLSNWNLNNCTTLSNTFGGCYNLITIKFPSTFTASVVTSFSLTFNDCYSLKNIINIDKWTPSLVTDCGSMFQRCYSLKELNIKNWNIPNCTNVSSLFNCCYNLKNVDFISTWTVGQITNLSYFIGNCISIKKFPNISNWNLSKVTNLSYICGYCYQLEEVTITNLNVPICTNISSMFYYCYNLKKINLSGMTIDTTKVTSASSICYYCHNLTTITGIALPALATSFSNSLFLSHESLLVILNAAPTLSSTKTLTLGSTNLNKLTATEKAIATGKGWTLA